MSYTVVLPGALVPASIADRLLARASVPALARRLARATPQALEPLDGDEAPHRTWLWRQFGGTGRAITAPYAWRALNQASATDVDTDVPLWFADPVHFAFARDHLLVATLAGESAPSADESTALAQAAAEIAGEAGAQLRVIGTTQWFLAFDPAWQIETVGLDAALGRSVEHVLPTGTDAARWRKLLTEIQMTWHQHPVNERREATGAPAINGVWLHGGGAYQGLPRRPFDTVIADDPIVRGWALAAGVPPGAIAVDPDRIPPKGSVLVYDPALLRAASHEDWDAWLTSLAALETRLEATCARAFASGHADVTWVLAGRTHVRCVVLRDRDRWAVWRRQRIDARFAEPEPA